MSLAVSPSPRPLSGSLLVIETSRTVGLGSHLSATVMFALISTSLWSGDQSTLGDTCTVSSGGTLSVMVILCVADDVLVEASFAVHVTVVRPTGKSIPPGALFPTNGEASQISSTIGDPMSSNVFAPVHSSVLSPGALMSGAILSRTVTLVEASANAPNASITLNQYSVGGSLPTVRRCSTSGLWTPATYVPFRLPRNHANDAMLFSGSFTTGSSENTPRLGSLALHSNVCGPASSSTVGGWLTSLPLMFASISRFPVFNTQPFSEHVPFGLKPPRSTLIGSAASPALKSASVSLPSRPRTECLIDGPPKDPAPESLFNGVFTVLAPTPESSKMVCSPSNKKSIKLPLLNVMFPMCTRCVKPKHRELGVPQSVSANSIRPRGVLTL